MDLFSHGLWTAAAGKGINDFVLKPRAKKPLKLRWLVWWGIFPDIFAFTIPIAWIIGGILLGDFKFSDVPSPENMEPMASGKTNGIYQLSISLYNLSHSLIIFGAVFAMLFLILRRPVWELAAWPFHILIDIPTHSYQFYPTPFFWPISGIKFNGFSWGTPWFLIANYSAIFLAYLFLAIKEKRLRK